MNIKIGCYFYAKFNEDDFNFFTDIVKKKEAITVLLYLKEKYNLTKKECKIILNYNFFYAN